MTETAYKPTQWEKVDCPFCRSAESKLYERFGSELQYTYVKCLHCGLIYSSPRPKYDQDFIDAAYGSYYQFADNLELDDSTNISESSVPMFLEEIEYVSRYDKDKTAVLDIGSGMGSFLYAAKKRGYPVCVGLDVSEQMARFIERKLGVKVYIGQFASFDYPGKFSLIHMSHVLEHVPNPNEWMEKAASLLTPGGVLVINVPHKYSMGNRLQHFFVKTGLKKQFSSSWKNPARTPDHLFEPTLPSLKFLVEKHGFEILEMYTYSRKDPASIKSLPARLMNRVLKKGSNIACIVRKRN
jgi:SAM-dependent methyltransferase